jgi:anaerobic selenocysteine-containing dehydrogenase
MFNFVRLSDGGPARHAGTRAEVDVIATIAERIFNGEPASVGDSPQNDGNGQSAIRNSQSAIDWSAMHRTETIRQAIARIVPGFEQIAEIDRTKHEFQIGGRTFHEPRFATPDGRARLHPHDLPDLQATGDNEVRLMTIRSEGQFNTVVYEDEDIYRGVEGRDVILLHPDDLARFGLDDGMRITVHGPAGSMPNVRASAFPQIRPGNAAMYYPESNVLVSRALDPQRKTPAFKGVVVCVERKWNCRVTLQDVSNQEHASDCNHEKETQNSRRANY